MQLRHKHLLFCNRKVGKSPDGLWTFDLEPHGLSSKSSRKSCTCWVSESERLPKIFVTRWPANGQCLRWTNEHLWPMWPDVEIKSCPNFPKVVQVSRHGSFYFKRDVLKYPHGSTNILAIFVRICDVKKFQ